MGDTDFTENTFRNGLLRYFSQEELDKIEAQKIFIAGCGGLGSNIACLLARTGFLHFTVVDFDTVDASNLNRQFFFLDQIGEKKTAALANNLFKINPAINLTLLDKFLDSSVDIALITKDSDILIEAFDAPKSKAFFVAAAIETGKPVISASGLAGYGDTDALTITNPIKNLWLVGDQKRGIDSAPPLAPRVMVAAAKQADLVVDMTLNPQKFTLNKSKHDK